MSPDSGPAPRSCWDPPAPPAGRGFLGGEGAAWHPITRWQGDRERGRRARSGCWAQHRLSPARPPGEGGEAPHEGAAGQSQGAAPGAPAAGARLPRLHVQVGAAGAARGRGGGLGLPDTPEQMLPPHHQIPTLCPAINSSFFFGGGRWGVTGAQAFLAGSWPPASSSPSW